MTQCWTILSSIVWTFHQIVDDNASQVLILKGNVQVVDVISSSGGHSPNTCMSAWVELWTVTGCVLLLTLAVKNSVPSHPRYVHYLARKRDHHFTCIKLHPALEQSWKINGIVTAVVVALSLSLRQLSSLFCNMYDDMYYTHCGEHHQEFCCC